MALTAQVREYYTRSIHSALSLQSDQKSRWEQSNDFLRLRWFDRNMAGAIDERTEVHYVHAYRTALIATLYSKNPTVQVKGRTDKSFPIAQTMQDVLSYQKDELKLKPAVQSTISDTVPYGIGWIEVGYTPPMDSYRPSYKPKKSVVETAKDVINKMFAPPNPEERAEGQLLPDVRGGRVFLRWIPAYRVLLAPGYHDISEMPYLIVIEDVAPEEFASNPRYNPKVVEQAKPTRTISSKAGKVLTPVPAIAKIFKPRAEGDTKFIRVYHIHDRRNMRKVGFADGVPDELYDEPWGCAFDEFSLVPLIFNDTPASEDDANAYPMDDITPIKPQLIEKSLLRTSMIKMRRRMAPIIIVDKNMYTPEEMALLQETEEAVIIPVNGGVNGFTPVNPVKVPDDIFRIDATIMSDLTLVSGYDQLLMAGQAQKGIGTATEASLLAQGTTLRTSWRVDIIETFLFEVFRRLAAYDMQYLAAVDVAEIIGKPVSEEMWPNTEGMEDSEINKTIRRELNIQIEAKSTQPDQVRLVEANLAIRDANMVTAAFGDVLDKAKYFRYYMKKKGDKDFEWTMKPETEPSKQEAAQEDQMMLQGIPVMAHAGDRHDVHIAAHGQTAMEMSQIPGADTTLIDKHIEMHAQLMQMENPKAGQRPQSGDSLSPQQAAVPEMQRTGGEDFADMSGSSVGASPHMGPENSMTP